MIEGQENEVKTLTGLQIEIETEIETTVVIVVIGEGIMIVGTETMIVIMIEIEDMIVNEIENQIDLAVMIRGVGKGHVLIQENAPGIMIDAGVMIGMIDTEALFQDGRYETLRSVCLSRE